MPVLRQTEASIESSAVTKIKKLGVLSRKMNGMGFRGWPDRLFLIPGGCPVFIEFKRPGGKLTPLQAFIIDRLRDCDYLVWVCYSAEEALNIIKTKLAEK